MFNAIISGYKNLHLLARFVVNILLLVVCWFIFYGFIRHSACIDGLYVYISNKFTTFLLVASKILLSLFGYETEVEGKVIRIVGTSGVLLDKGCLGRNLLGLFIGFIIAYPGKIKHKLWTIPLGVLIIFFLNIVRISALVYLVADYPQYVDINHHVIFKYTVYFFIFCMWYLWIKYYSASSNKRKKIQALEKRG